MPGMLPVINDFCVEQAVRTGLGLKAKINLSRASTARTISIPTCRRATRSASSSIPIVGEGEVLVDLGPGETRRSASSGCISSRTPASRSTTSIRLSPSSISTVPAWR
jgi:Asp-tRNA(Asn)/Glu-tRNA(Gln) amidotransferase B subunit